MRIGFNDMHFGSFKKEDISMGIKGLLFDSVKHIGYNFKRMTWKDNNGEYYTSDYKAHCNDSDWYGLVKGNIVTKLGEYEDTEMTPADIEVVKEQYNRMKDLNAEILTEMERITKENKELRFLNDIHDEVLDNNVNELTDEIKKLKDENNILSENVDYWKEHSDYWQDRRDSYYKNRLELNSKIEELTGKNEELTRKVDWLLDIISMLN